MVCHHKNLEIHGAAPAQEDVAVDWSPVVVLGCVGAGAASFGAGAIACGWLLRAYCEREAHEIAQSVESCRAREPAQSASPPQSRTRLGLELLDARRKLHRENQAVQPTDVSAERVRILDVRSLRAEAARTRGLRAR